MVLATGLVLQSLPKEHVGAPSGVDVCVEQCRERGDAGITGVAVSKVGDPVGNSTKVLQGFDYFNNDSTVNLPQTFQ